MSFVYGPDDFGDGALGLSSFGIADAIAVTSPTDSAPATDAATRVIVLIRTATDSAPASDAITNDIALHFRTSADSIPVPTDSNTRVVFTFRSGSDSAPASDSAARLGLKFFRTTPDSAPASDAITNDFVKAFRTASDSIAGASDSASRLFKPFRSASDSAPAPDAATRLAVYFRTAGDSAPASDSATGIGGKLRTGSDSITVVSDVAIRAMLPYKRGPPDSAPASDALTSLTSHFRTAPDSAPASDSLAQNLLSRVGRPSADITTANWFSSLGGALYVPIDEVDPNDADFDYTTWNPPTSLLAEVRLSSMTPATDAAKTKISYRIRKQGAKQGDLVVRLVQGTTVVASWPHVDLPRTYSLFEQILTATQLAAITNWADLRLRFEATVT